MVNRELLLGLGQKHCSVKGSRNFMQRIKCNIGGNFSPSKTNHLTIYCSNTGGIIASCCRKIGREYLKKMLFFIFASSFFYINVGNNKVQHGKSSI